MLNQKTIILGLISILVLVGVVLYSDSDQEVIDDQAASIVGDSVEPQFVDTSVDLTKELILGDLEASVTIVEYASHFCEFCAEFHKETLPLISEKYIITGKVKLVSRLVSPLELGASVLCANEQGSFPEMNEYLFEHAKDISSIEQLKTIASTLELNQSEFDDCFDSNKYEDMVQHWFEQAIQDEIAGTPTFFINGQKIVGNQPYDTIEEVIEQALSRVQ